MFRKSLGIFVIAAGFLAYGSAVNADPLQPGASAPNFTLPSQENTPVSLSDYKGKWIVLYFYPKDMSPGCTVEAHNFQRDLGKYDAANAVVLGVSLDTVEHHKTFCTKDSLTFKLLADDEGDDLDSVDGMRAEPEDTGHGTGEGKTDEKRVVDPLLERGAAGDHAGRLNNGDGLARPGKCHFRSLDFH